MVSASSSTRATLARATKLALVVAVVAAQASNITGAGPDFNPANYYSYFTTLSNALAAIIAAWALIGRVPDSLRGMSVTSLLLVVLVVMTLLGGIEVGRDSFGSIVMHSVTALLAVVDWLLDPPRKRLSAKAVLWWLLLPAGYLAVTLIRGAMIDWYPYNFLDPTQSGYLSVTLTCLAVSAVFIPAAYLVRWVGNRLRG